MAEPRTLEEREVPDSVVSFPQQPQPIGPPAAPQVPQRSLAMVYHGIAMVLAARLQCLLLVIAMIVLSGAAIISPVQERLYGAAGFDVLALIGLVILGRRP